MLLVQYRGQAKQPANAAALDDVAAPDGFFDDIEYQKGGCVLRMLRAYLNSDRIAAPQLAYATGGRKLFQVLQCPGVSLYGWLFMGCICAALGDMQLL